MRDSLKSGLLRELTILLDLLIEVVYINSMVGSGLGNCHGGRCRGRAERRKKVTSTPGLSKSFDRGGLNRLPGFSFQEDVR